MKTKQSFLPKIFSSNRPVILAGIIAIFACSKPLQLFAWGWTWQADDLRDQLARAHEAESSAQSWASIGWAFGLISLGCIVYLLKNRTVIKKEIKNEIIEKVVRNETIVRSPAHELVADMVVIDGLNVIHGSCSNPRPALNNLIGLLLELQKQHCKFKCFFDPETFFVLARAGQRSDAYAYRRLCYDFPGLFIEVSVTNEADEYVLAYAHKHGTPIISNDRYRDYDEKYPWLKSEPKRRTPFLVDSGVMQILPLGIEAQIPNDLEAAEASLRGNLGKPAPVIPAVKSLRANSHLPINGEVLAAS